MRLHYLWRHPPASLAGCTIISQAKRCRLFIGGGGSVCQKAPPNCRIVTDADLLRAAAPDYRHAGQAIEKPDDLDSAPGTFAYQVSLGVAARCAGEHRVPVLPAAIHWFGCAEVEARLG